MKTVYNIIIFLSEFGLEILSEKIWCIFFFSIIWGLIFGWEVGLAVFGMTYFLEFSQVIYDAIKRYQPNTIHISDATIHQTGTVNNNTK